MHNRSETSTHGQRSGATSWTAAGYGILTVVLTAASVPLHFIVAGGLALGAATEVGGRVRRARQRRDTQSPDVQPNDQITTVFRPGPRTGAWARRRVTAN
jgi:hypothetical protein